MIVLGSTGSIGTQTLDLARRFNIEVGALVAGDNVDLLQSQIDEFRPKIVVCKTKKGAKLLRHDNVLYGNEAIDEALQLCRDELVVNALVGFTGLAPSLKANALGKKIALANKESLVIGGKFLDTSKIIPIDSEHFGLQELTKNAQDIKKLIITASGGALRNKEIKSIASASVQEVLAHPNWSMGKKITTDSASMVNKLFEVLEAMWLFGTKNIDALIEPTSNVHAVVEFADGSTMMHIAPADMQLVIAHALDLKGFSLPCANLLDLNLSFKPIDISRYPLWELKDALLSNPDLGVVLNGANDFATKRFLEAKIPFGDIAKIITKTIKAFDDVKINSHQDIFIVHDEIQSFLDKI